MYDKFNLSCPSKPILVLLFSASPKKKPQQKLTKKKLDVQIL